MRGVNIEFRCAYCALEDKETIRLAHTLPEDNREIVPFHEGVTL